jgi:hypothetical protein
MTGTGWGNFFVRSLGQALLGIGAWLLPPPLMKAKVQMVFGGKGSFHER